MEPAPGPRQRTDMSMHRKKAEDEVRSRQKVAEESGNDGHKNKAKKSKKYWSKWRAIQLAGCGRLGVLQPVFDRSECQRRTPDRSTTIILRDYIKMSFIRES
jgi:hypothetical protein